MMLLLGLGVTRGGHPGKPVITNTPDCLDHSHTCRSALLMQRLNAISQLTLHTGHTNARYMQHGQDAITTVECKVQSFQSALRCREERVVLLGSKQPSLDHWSCHHPLLLTVGGGLLESYFSNIYFQQILLKGCHVVRMMMMVMATVLKYCFLSQYIVSIS